LKPEFSFFRNYFQRELLLPLDAQRETSKSGVEKRDDESVKKRWLTVESFMALLN
jgi:hypothetical protein